MTRVANHRAKSFSTLEPILSHWTRLNSQLALDWAGEDDVPWWYNERASLSIFAGAVWRAGGWAFEEFSMPKSSGRRAARAMRRKGRCDIMFGIGDHAFVAEAKQAWPNIGGSILAAIDKSRTALRDACRDALRDSAWGYPRLGIAFAVPVLHLSKLAQMDELVARFVTGLSVGRDTSIAYTFVATASEAMPSHGYYVFPGVVVLVKRAR